MEKKLIIILALVLSCVFFSCATQKAVQMPPAGSIIAEQPTLTLGSKFIFRETDVLSKEVTDYIWTIKQIQAYEGSSKPAYFFSICKYADGKIGSEEYCLVYNHELNAMTRLVDGREVRAATPCIQTFSWPLWPGKKWYTSYNFFGEKGRGDIRDYVVVESYEQFKVPAGTFNVFKIKRVSLSQTHWEFTDYYSPEVKMFIRSEKFRLASHSEGYGKWITELVSYQIL